MAVFQATELFYKSPLTKTSIFCVESVETGEELIMKAIKNERCVTIALKYELDLLRNLNHPNLPNFVYVEYNDYFSYVVFEKCKGYIVWDPASPCCYRRRPIKQISYQVARALQHTHAYGVLHRDLRPANIFIHSPKYEKRRLKVTLVDLGISKALESDLRLADLEDGPAWPTAYVRQEYCQYPPPEVLLDMKQTTQVDSWFLGILMYIMICGRIPFRGETDDQIKQSILRDRLIYDNENWLQIESDLDELITGLLQKDAKNRLTVDNVLWSPWIPKTNWVTILRVIYFEWSYGLKELPFEVVSCLNQYCGIGLTAILDVQNDLVSIHNNNTTAIHQSKIWNFDSQTIDSTCFININATLGWVDSVALPLIYEFKVQFAKNDIYFGIFNFRFEENDSLYHYIGSDDNSFGISLRDCVAHHNGKVIKRLGRNHHNNNYLNNDGPKHMQQFKPLHQSRTSNIHLLDTHNMIFDKSEMGPQPIRNQIVKLRVDPISRTLSVNFNGYILEPLYFELNSDIQCGVTLCHCLDQIELTAVYVEIPP